MCLLVMCVSSLEKCIFKFIVHFLTGAQDSALQFFRLFLLLIPLESSANRRLTINRYREGVLFINMLVKMKNYEVS